MKPLLFLALLAPALLFAGIPAHMDRVPLYNGCYISYWNYAKRLPKELKVTSATVRLPSGVDHILAVVTDTHGKQYIRDGVMGVRRLKGTDIQACFDDLLRASAGKSFVQSTAPTTPRENQEMVEKAQRIVGGNMVAVESTLVLVWTAPDGDRCAYAPVMGTVYIAIPGTVSDSIYAKAVLDYVHGRTPGLVL